jgi:hypothetical protein
VARGLKNYLERVWTMGRNRSGTTANRYPIRPIELELTMHLERAHQLGERAKRSNGAVQEEIERARQIANTLCNEVADLPTRSQR